MKENSNARVETELEVKTYIDHLKYTLENGAKIVVQVNRRVDQNRDYKFTNQYTIHKLFPNEDPIEALKRELMQLTVENYMRTVKDIRFPNRSEMREFGKVYNEDDVYIKIRVEVLGAYGNTHTFVMSFHFAERPFTDDMFPYKE